MVPYMRKWYMWNCMNVYRIYNRYYRKKDFRDRCVKRIRKFDKLGDGQKSL